MGQELRTRYKIQDTVRVVSVVNPPLCSMHWAVGQVGLIRRVFFDLFGVGFVVEVCHPANKMCFAVECRKVKRVPEAKG
jgi:hypothetical protein